MDPLRLSKQLETLEEKGGLSQPARVRVWSDEVAAKIGQIIKVLPLGCGGRLLIRKAASEVGVKLERSYLQRYL